MSEKPTGDNCGNCLFSVMAKITGQPDQLLCRRFPPTPVVVLQQVKPTPANPAGVFQAVVAHFPPIAENMICGEWRTRDRMDVRAPYESGLQGAMRGVNSPSMGPVLTFNAPGKT